MDNPNITMEEYIRLEEEKARRRAIVFNDTLTSEAALSCEPTDSENDNDKVNMPLLPSPKPMVSYFDDLDFFKDFENEFPAIVYNDAKDFKNEFSAIVYHIAQTSKSDLLTEPILNPQNIDVFNLKDETSLSECDEEEQNVLNFNDLFPFNVIYPNDSKSDKDNDDDKVDIEHSSEDLSVKPLPDLINTDVGAYAHGSNELLETKYVKFWDDWEVDRYGNANLGDLDNLTSNVLIPLDSWTSGLLVYKLPLSGKWVTMDNPNITMEDYIRLEEEKARRRAIVFYDTLTSEVALSCEPMVTCLNNDEIKFRISFDESNNEDCTKKGIKREYSVARTPQQNGVAERRNRTLIEAARTMLADSKLPTTFWAEAVSTACYVQNRVLVVKPHNKTPYELFRGFKPALSFMRPFGCHVTILNTLDSLGKFDGKSDEGFFVGYSLSSKAFRVYNTRTRRVEENLHIGFLENKPMIEGNGPKWLFDIDSLTQSMNYVPIAAGTITNESADASYFDSPSKDVDNGEPKSAADDQKQVEDGPDNENDEKDKYEDDSSPKEVNTAGQHVNTASPEVNTGRFKLNTVDPSVNTVSSYDQDNPKDMFTMGASHTLTHVEFFSDEDEPEVDLGNITNSYRVPTTPNIRIHKDWPIKNVIGDVKSSVQTRIMTKPTSEQGFLSAIEPTSIAKALSDSSWVEAMQEELLQFKLQQVWILVDLPIGKRAIGTKWVFRNKKDERGIVIRNKARLVAQGHRQEEGLKVQQKEDGIFISQDKYVAEILKKFNYTNVKSASTLVDLEKPLVKDGDAVMLIFQVTPKTSHLLAVKRIFRYLKGKQTLGLWYSRDSTFELVAYTDSDYAGATQDRKSTTGGYLLTKGFDAGSHIHYALTASPIIYTSLIKQFWQTAALCTIDDGVLGIIATIDKKVKITVSKGSIRRHLKLEDSEGIPSLPTAETFKQLTLMEYVTTSDSLTFQKGHFSL
ncbi:putative ribonuclease H-like domain-containing protein [Tanacetum coccineum]